MGLVSRVQKREGSFEKMTIFLKPRYEEEYMNIEMFGNYDRVAEIECRQRSKVLKK